MRYKQGVLIVMGKPTIAWVRKMESYGLIFRVENGVIYAELERS